MSRPITLKQIDEKTARLRAARLAREVSSPAIVAPRRLTQVLGLADELPFGKHRGETVEDVLGRDPSYITWMLENIADYELSEEAECEYYARLDPIRPRD